MASLEDLDEKTRQQLAFAQKILGDKDLSKQARRLVRDKFPDFNAPDLDLEDQFDKSIKDRDKKIEELESKLSLDMRNRAWEREQQKIKDAGYDVPFIEELMKKEQIASVDTAIKHANMQSQLAVPTPSTIGDVLPTTKEGDVLNKWWKNPRKTQTEELYAAVNELRGPRQPGR